MEKKPLSTEEANAAIQADKDQRINSCSEAIAEVLKKNNCILDVSVVIKLDSVKPQISIIAI